MKTYTDEFKKTALARIDAGEKLKAVAAELKVDKSTIGTWRRKARAAGKTPAGRKNGHSPKVRARALTLLASGKTQAEVAKSLKVTAAIVHYWRGVQNKEAKGTPTTKKGNGADHGTDKRDVRDAMVFFHKALKLAKQKGLDPLKDSVLLNVAYGVSLLETKM